jgi:hypothetical protein
MNRGKVLFCFIISVVLITAAGCSRTVEPSEEISVDKLLAAPLALEISNQSLSLSTYISRDFMPRTDGNGPALNAIAYIATADGTVINPSISSDKIYFVYNRQMWKADFSNWYLDEYMPNPSRIVKVLRDGPKLDTGISVDVIVIIKVGSHEYLLRAEKQFVYMVN